MTKETVALIASIVALVLAIGCSVALWYIIFRRPPSGQHAKPQALRPLKVSVPTFGAPRRRVYHRADYGDEALRCAGDRCGHRQLGEGELFMEIPLPDQGPGAVLAVCMPCNQANANVLQGAEES